MIKILFVCHGNICRSPMAEFVFRDIIEKEGYGDHIHIASSATSMEEIGNRVHYGTRKKLQEHGISCEGKRSIQLRREDYGKYDLLIGMDSANIRNMHRILGGDNENKISLLLQFAGDFGDIADPWYTGDFEATYRDVVKGCNGLLVFLKVTHGVGSII